jgi:hypothetical protein
MKVYHLQNLITWTFSHLSHPKLWQHFVLAGVSGTLMDVGARCCKTTTSPKKGETAFNMRVLYVIATVLHIGE